MQPNPMYPKILVTGAPGNVGTEVVRGLHALGVPYRVAAFDCDLARRTLPSSAEIVPFDFLNPETYAAAFAGIERLFLVRPPTLANVQKEIAPALRAAVVAGVRQIVFLSLQGVEKNRMVPHHKIEQCILELGVPYTFLRASFFMQNLTTTHRAEIRDEGQIALPVGKAKTSFIDVRDIGAVAVRALTEDGHANQRYTLTGAEALTYDQVAAALTAALGRPVRYTPVGVVAFLRRQLHAGRQFGFALVMAGLYTITRLGNAAHVTPDVEQLLGRRPISFAQFAQDYRESWV